MPDIASTVKKTLGDTWVFIRTAGVVILLASMCIWGLSYFPGVSVEEYTAMQERAASQGEQLPPRRTLSLHTSYMARVAEALSPIFKPLGFDWRTTVAVLAGFTGRGAVIATLNTFYGIEGGPEKSDVLTDALKKSAFYNSATVVSLMVFVLLSGSCLAGIAMFYHYVKSAWMTILFVAYPVTLAWIAAAIAYRIVPFLGIK
jgi:ferrous iron transport protein B